MMNINVTHNVAEILQRLAILNYSRYECVSLCVKYTRRFSLYSASAGMADLYNAFFSIDKGISCFYIYVISVLVATILLLRIYSLKYLLRISTYKSPQNIITGCRPDSSHVIDELSTNSNSYTGKLNYDVQHSYPRCCVKCRNISEGVIHCVWSPCFIWIIDDAAICSVGI